VKVWVHIITVGASSITNLLKEDRVLKSLKLNIKRLPELEKALLSGEVDRERLLQELIDFILKDPKKASAELHTCLDLLDEGYRRGRQQWVYLFHTDTEIGRLCAEALYRSLNKISHDKYDSRIACMEPREVRGLGNSSSFRDGLANLFEMIVNCIRTHKKKGDVIFVHATGGFKPESAIALLAANMPGLGAPVFYVHEHFKEVIRIPAIPLSLRSWEKFRGLMERIIEFTRLPRVQLVKQFGLNIVEEAIRIGWIEEDEGGEYLRATAMGRLLWKAIL